MEKENINNYYTDQDFINFEKLKDFKEFNTNKLNINQNNNNSLKYAKTDNEHFSKIININNSKGFLPKKPKKIQNNNHYNSLDLKNFDKINNFKIFSDNKIVNKKTETIKNKANYTTNDINEFHQIIKYESNIKNGRKNKINSNSDVKKIKIIDFDKLHKKEKGFRNKIGIEKIKIVYFD